MKTLRNAQAYKTITAGVTLLLSISLIAYSAQVFWRHRQVTHGATASIPTEVIVYSTQEPDETPPECQSYRVADHEPRKIEITSVGVDGCIQKVGIDQSNAIATPTNVHLGGWYTKSVSPGEKGISLIDGHVQGRYGKAIFSSLSNVEVGSAIRIQLGNGSWKSFETVDVKSYTTNTVMEHLFDPIDDAESQLTIITCGGLYDRQAREFNNRVVVRARLVP